MYGWTSPRPAGCPFERQCPAPPHHHKLLLLLLLLLLTTLYTYTHTHTHSPPKSTCTCRKKLTHEIKIKKKGAWDPIWVMRKKERKKQSGGCECVCVCVVGSNLDEFLSIKKGFSTNLTHTRTRRREVPIDDVETIKK